MKAGASPARLTVPSPGDQAEIAGAAEASRLANKLLAAHSYAEAHAAITDCITALEITPSLVRAAGGFATIMTDIMMRGLRKPA